MAPINWPPRSLMVHFEDSVTTQQQRKARSRPLPLRVRTYSVAGNRSADFDENRDGVYPRHKSISHTHTIDNAQFSSRSPPQTMESSEDDTIEQDSPRSSFDDDVSDLASLIGSPETPLTSLSSQRSSLEVDGPEVIAYDFSKLDYELERAKVLGQGLWSTVYLAEQKTTAGNSILASPRYRRKSRTSSSPLLFAVKTPVRPDAKAVFHQEARVLSHLQRRSVSSLYVVPFYGLDVRNESLVFEAVIGGSLEDLTSRLRVMPEVARHMELISIFPGIAFDLISGLDFLHSNGVIHADIKPGNVLLDISQHTEQQNPVIRARYIDFSAAFMPGKGDSASNAGGTWDFMAPEQMRIQIDLSTPTFASDIWSLGITLLSVMVGGSPYTAACGNNNFMLREAIKSGDPIGLAKMDPVPAKRLTACQDFVDCCRMALKKDRDNRVTAAAWTTWLAESEWEVGL
ncbi:Serine/threonine-protein kinase RUNKEL [Pseudocercospora fuligena]|uniref:Serine/threonine-protein kinase RUNKEL n=1 Tax=Pseudocercospora fuligena TaxID=685502 RepID=A0A8H6RAN9_9PEZI|nr:Serine/threonine-protein kinase RUNKEL [Pseudocercospora fuligena]